MRDETLEALSQASGNADLWACYDAEALRDGVPDAWCRYELASRPTGDGATFRYEGTIVTNDEDGDGEPDGEVVVKRATFLTSEALERSIHSRRRLGVQVDVFVDGMRR